MKNADRKPLEDEEAETLRVEAYWEWLDANPPSPSFMTGKEFVVCADDWHWVKLSSVDDADFEAFHMRHSIGHSWHKYSGFGDIWSLRSPNGVPAMTALLVNQDFVHFREERNARPSVLNRKRLSDFANAMGWGVKNEPPHFDDWAPRDAEICPKEPGYAEVVYLHRDPFTNEKAFHRAILDFNVTPANMQALRMQMDSGMKFIPSQIGLPVEPGHEGREHEIRSIRPSPGPCTHELGLSDVLVDEQPEPKV